MLMKRLIKEAKKEIKLKGSSEFLTELLASARSACQAIHEVILFVEVYITEDRY